METKIKENTILDFNDIVVQKIINKNITRSYWLMQGQGGYNKVSADKIDNLNFPVSYNEFRDEAELESGLIYIEAVRSYDPDHFIKIGKGETTIKFTSWLYWKLRDLDGRLWRLFSTGCTSSSDFIEMGKDTRFEDDFIFRESLSEKSRDILALLETGQGFKLKKSDEYKKVNCHMGIRNFWKSFIQPNEKYNYSFRDFLTSWNEIKKEWNEIETDSTIYTIMDNQAV